MQQSQRDRVLSGRNQPKLQAVLRRDGGSVEEDFGLGGTAVATQEDL